MTQGLPRDTLAVLNKLARELRITRSELIVNAVEDCYVRRTIQPVAPTLVPLPPSWNRTEQCNPPSEIRPCGKPFSA